MAFTIIASCTGCTACIRKCPVNAIRGERNQLHVIDPFLCIECGACGRICPSQAVLDGKSQPVERIKLSQWLKPVWDYPACVECRICVLACPTGSISLARFRPEANGMKPTYPLLHNPKTCIGCSFCAVSCPTVAIEMKAPLPLTVAAAE